MSRYQDIIQKISAQTGARFRAASPEDLLSLQGFHLPQTIIDFYALHEPSTCVQGQVRLWPISAILEENRDLVPGAYTAPLGYIVFATTLCGDTYCFDLNKLDIDDEPRIVLISHEVVDEDITAEEAARLAKPVAGNLHEFLDKFNHNHIDEDCIY